MKSSATTRASKAASFLGSSSASETVALFWFLSLSSVVYIEGLRPPSSYMGTGRPLRRLQHGGAKAAGKPLKLGDFPAIAGRHRDGADTGAPRQGLFAGFGHQALARAGGRQKHDGGRLRHRRHVARIAGIGEGGVGQRENDAPMRDGMAVQH